MTPAPHASPGTSTSGAFAVKTLLLTDLVDSTRLFEKLGDRRASELMVEHDRRARQLMEAHGAREIDKSDGFFLLFERPIDAVRFALAYHDDLEALSGEAKVELAARCGIHLGEVLLRHNPPDEVRRGAKPLEVDGLAKPAAARLMSLALGRQTLLTHSAFELARRAASGSGFAERKVRWLAHGPFRFKGVDEPQEVFEVGVEGFAPLTVPPNSEKVDRAVAPGDEITLGWRPAPEQPIPRRPGWIVREKLGEGGFGEVWLAQHGNTAERRVFKFCYEPRRLRSLQREVTLFRLLRETLGRRGDIVRILDWNFDEAPFSIEIDYIEGGSLADWAKAQGGLDEVPFAQRCEIVAQVAEALAAAHSVGVLHKDVKPGNILIDVEPGSGGQGVPRAVLTDFGVGTLTDRERLAAQGITSLGLTGVTLASESSPSSGTPLYMAPELLAGGVASVQADIYALGVLLYQMVVGDLDRPLAQGWQRDVDDELLREDIAAFADGLPERRPGSASEVAERLRRLADRRTARHAERRARREAERAHRRRRVLGTIAAVSSLFVVVATYLALQAVAARMDAEVARDEAEGLIDFMLGDLRDSLEPIGRLDLLEKVARGSQRYFTALDRDAETPDRAAQRGTTFLNIGEVLRERGDTEGALRAFEEAQRIFDRLLARAPGHADSRLGQVWSQVHQGSIRYIQGDAEAALARGKLAHDLATELAGEDPADRDRRFVLAYVQSRLGKWHAARGATDLARRQLREALQNAESLITGEVIEWQHRQLVLDLYADLGRLEDLETSLEIYATASALARRLTAEEPANVLWLRKLAYLDLEIGVTYLEQMESYESAFQALQGAVDAYRALMEREPANVSWQAGFAQSTTQLGRIHAERGEAEEAEILYAEAAEIFEGLAAKDPTRLIWQHWVGWLEYLEGNLRAEIGDEGMARQAWSRAVEHFERLYDQSPTVDRAETFALALLKLGRIEQARPLVEEVMAVERRHDPELREWAAQLGLGPA